MMAIKLSCFLKSVYVVSKICCQQTQKAVATLSAISDSGSASKDQFQARLITLGFDLMQSNIKVKLIRIFNFSSPSQAHPLNL